MGYLKHASIGDRASKRYWLKRVLAVGALAQLAFPSKARAQDTWAAGLGLRLYVALEDTGGTGFGWNLNAFGTRLVDGENHICSAEARTAIGPVVGFGALGLRAPRISLSSFVGRESERGGFAFGGELGLSYRMGEQQGLGIHTALLPSGTIFHLLLQREWLLGETGIGGGAWYEMPYGELGMCVEGRALRDAEGSIARLDPGVRAGAGAAVDCVAPKLALAAFARDAQAECESVTAFLQLALELVDLGAPAALIERALVAAEQEIEHARLVASLSGRFGGSVCPEFPAPVPRPAPTPEDALARLAVESYLDGCVGEAWAARRAADGSRTANDPEIRGVRARIAREESAHVELGWQLVDFALERGGGRVAEALRAVRDTGFSGSFEAEPEASDWLELGRVSSCRNTELAELTLREARRSLDRRLSQRA
jgi:hypothetical protein